MRNKEYGSDFHYPIDPQWSNSSSKGNFFTNSEVTLFFSGRSALYHLLAQGIKQLNWKKVYLPSYYCHEVGHYIDELLIEVHYFEFNPVTNTSIELGHIPDRTDSVLVNTSFFGMNTVATSHLRQTIIIEDLTHKLNTCETSKAHYCFGSLRKELPVGVGGFCYSPQGLALPRGSSHTEANNIAQLKIDAMGLKEAYLRGSSDDKSTYLEQFAQAELQFEAVSTRASMPDIARQQLSSLDIDAILVQKQKNVQQAMEALSHLDQVTVLGTPNNRPTFGLVFQCKIPEVRTALRLHLIENNIFPAILWPDQLQEKDRMLEETILFIHTDFRYTTEDISEITKTITSYFTHA